MSGSPHSGGNGRAAIIRLSRRSLLQGGVAALLGLACTGLTLPGPLHAQTYAAQVSLLLDGIGPGFDPDRLEAAVAPFLAAGLPVTCVADLAGLTRDLTLGQPLCDRMAILARRDPGLFDLALPIGKLPRTERYFQLRRAGELREAVVRAFREGPAALQSFPVVTLIDRGEDPNIDHTAFRGAGFRIHLRAGDGPLSLVPAGRGELVGTGGIWAGLEDPGLAQRIGAALDRGQDLILALSLPATGTVADLAARAGDLAEILGAATGRGRIHMASPARLRLHAGTGLPLDVALLVEAGAGLEEDEALLAFVNDLAGLGVPLTLTGQPERFGTLPGTVAFCALPETETTAAAALPDCLRETPDMAEPSDVAIAVHLGAESAVWTAQGIDAEGRLRLTLRQIPEGSPDRVLDLSPLEDHVIAIRAADVLQPVRRAQLVRRLAEASRSGQAYFHTLPGLAAHLVETEPVLARLWSVRRRNRTDPLRPPAPDEAELQRLIEDARLAWRYIERFTDPKTGLCAGTVQGGKALVINPEVTMWDLASQLHAIRVASQLGLIDTETARERVRLLLGHLPSDEIDGYRLPPAMFRTDSLAVVTRGFDVCDTGRFLIALRAAQAGGLVDAATVTGLLAGWDLAAALPEGRPHSHLGNIWIDTTLSHCTPYIRRGLVLWGFDLVSPYSGLAQGTVADREIAFLYDVAAIGQVGVEPVLLETIELGADPGAALIANVLFDAQLDWFETTGRLKCASEAPLNFPPWFSYQGLRFGDLGAGAWVVRGLGDAPEHETLSFREKAELLSTKSAYLWSAVRSHPYCDRLLQLMRDKTRIEGLGFSVGVFAATMEAMPGYSDLNTNGVILTAIGHALR